MEIEVSNVNYALRAGLQYILRHGIEEKSRNGPVLVAPEPVMTIYQRPWERVLFAPMRDANPFFHVMEALWMLAGRNDVGFPSYFNKNFAQYSDNGRDVHGAYGYRWRTHFGFDQLPVIIRELKANPQTRRCVLQMWDCSWADDLNYAVTPGTKDAPCNTQVYFDVRGGKLNMTVLCRSNDIFWGAYGANAVHFSFLQEYVAAMSGYSMGVYRQFSNNYHLYTELYPGFEKREKFYELINQTFDIYRSNAYTLVELVTEPDTFGAELAEFVHDPENPRSYENKFFSGVARPMYLTWRRRKEHHESGYEYATDIAAGDWRANCLEWIARRKARTEAKQAS